MRDPHVSELYYYLKTSDTVSFDNPPVLDWKIASCSGRLSAGVLRIDLIDHFASEEAARSRVDSFLRSWEISAGLELGSSAIWFEFNRSKIIDRNPPTSGDAQVLGAQGISSSEAVGTARMCEVRKRYPSPPSAFISCPDVETMWHRFESYREGKEPLTSMAYMCLSVLEASVTGKNRRAQVAKQYRIEKEVLGKLGYLTGDVGDEKTARKMSVSEKRKHTAREIAWIEAVVKGIIRRVGEYAHDPNAHHVVFTMKDLPPLGL